MAGTVLGSQEPEQKRLSEGSRLAWTSQIAEERYCRSASRLGSLSSQDLGYAWLTVREAWLV